MLIILIGQATEFVLCDHVSRTLLVSVQCGKCIRGQLRHEGVRILGILINEIMKQIQPLYVVKNVQVPKLLGKS